MATVPISAHPRKAARVAETLVLPIAPDDNWARMAFAYHLRCACEAALALVADGRHARRLIAREARRALRGTA